MKIYVTSLIVDDQEKALKFYTETLGFVKKNDVPVGEFKWLTVVSPEDPNGTEILLEPNDNPAALAFQRSIFEQGIPQKSLAVENIQNDYERLTKLGVNFTIKPAPAGPVTVAVFNDTCGNLIQMVQPN